MTGGKSPIGYLKAYMTNLYLSKDAGKVTEAIEEGELDSFSIFKVIIGCWFLHLFKTKTRFELHKVWGWNSAVLNNMPHNFNVLYNRCPCCNVNVGAEFQSVTTSFFFFFKKGK